MFRARVRGAGLRSGPSSASACRPALLYVSRIAFLQALEGDLAQSVVADSGLEVPPASKRGKIVRDDS